jgi:hypothetical protein
MFSKFAAFAAAGACALVSAAPAGAATFDFAARNNWTLTDGGITVYASAWYTPDLVQGPQRATLGISAGTGYGLTVSNPQDQNTATVLEQHTIDNINGYDFVALYFTSAVKLTGMTLNAFKVLSNLPIDKDAWVGYGNINDQRMWNDPQAVMNDNWAQLLGTAMQASNGAMTSEIGSKVGNVWLIGAQRTAVTSDRNDGFKLGAVSAVAATPANTPAVPEPATWATMMLGLGLAGAALRRRRTAVAFA